MRRAALVLAVVCLALPAWAIKPIPFTYVVAFAPGSATLDVAAGQVVATVARNASLVGEGAWVQVAGFAPRNDALSAWRGAAVRDALRAAGVAGERLELVPPGALTGHELARPHRVEIDFCTAPAARRRCVAR